MEITLQINYNYKNTNIHFNPQKSIMCIFGPSRNLREF